MNVCMIVHNSGTRDGRVMREARALQQAGHSVTVLGVPEAGATKTEECLPDGVRVVRVSYRRHRALRPMLQGMAAILAVAAIGYVSYRLYGAIVAADGLPTGGETAGVSSRTLLAFGMAALAAVFLLFSVLYATGAVGERAAARAREQEHLRRKMISGADENLSQVPFPAIRSRIPNWIPDWLLEIMTAPLALLGAGVPSFWSYRRRARLLASAAIRLGPDVVHCHDCSTLPIGWIVKNALGIPLVYDAHEIYEAVASRKLGTTDYFARVHARYLPGVAAFIAVNDSAANYYRHAYPGAPRAVVIRNATEHAPVGAYDGRLHRAAGLKPEQKVLLYQGGFTKHRGLETLVQSAHLLPPEWSLVMMGKGPLLPTLRAIGSESQSAGKFCFVPAVPAEQLLSWTQGATVGIIPYEDTVLNHWIATPNKLWEYPNAGVPMIVQPFAEMRRVVETYGCGWVLPEAFSAEAIRSLVASLTPEMIHQARAGCRRFVEADNWDVYRRRLVALYEKLKGQVLVTSSPAPAGAGSEGAHLR